MNSSRRYQRVVLTATLLILLCMSVASSAMIGYPVQAQNISDVNILTLSTTIIPTPNPAILIKRTPVTLVQQTGVMIIDSIPSGASLSIDGTFRGITPFTIRTISAGTHRLTLRMTGYDDFSTSVTVPDGGNVKGVYTMVPSTTETANVTIIPGQPATGVIFIDSIPSGASLSIDGAPAGTTPYISRTIPSGDHAVVLTFSGYADLSSTVTIPPGGTFREIYTMSCNVLTVSSTPSGASLFIDGILKGTTPLTIRAIPAGTHTVLLKSAGYTDYTTPVTIPPGVEVTMVSTMVSLANGSATSTMSGSIQVPVTNTVVSSNLPTTIVPVQVTESTSRIDRDRYNCTRYYLNSGELMLSSEGKLNCTTFISSDDFVTTLQITEGTRITGSEKNPVSVIRVNPIKPDEITQAGSDGSIWTGYAYHYLPDHASFDPPVLVSFTLSREAWEGLGPLNLTIKETNENDQGWENLPTIIDPEKRTASAPVRHFSIIGLFSTGPAANVPDIPQAFVGLIRQATGSKNVSLPSSAVIPDPYAPLAAVAAGITLSVIGSLAAGNAGISRLWDKMKELLEKFLGSETTGLMNVSEIEKRGIIPAENLSAIILGLSFREILVIAVSTLGFATAFILQNRLELNLITVIIFLFVGGIATILHDLAHKYSAYRAGCNTEYQFWSLGTVTMLSTAWLFGNAFAKPSRTVIKSETNPSLEKAARIKLSGPLMSMAVAIVSLFLIPLGGLFVIAGSAGFSMNLLNCVFSLVPVRPNDGVEIYAWNKLIWALVFVPVMVFYLYIYFQL